MLELRETKGIACLVLPPGFDPEALHLHVSEIGPGQRAHPPHQHPGREAFFVLAGTGEVEIGGARQRLEPGSAAAFDARELHGLRNVGDAPLRYLVIIARPESH